MEREGETDVHRNELKYLEKKLVEKGFKRLERKPARGIRGEPPKSGHGGKFTWEGPDPRPVPEDEIAEEEEEEEEAEEEEEIIKDEEVKDKVLDETVEVAAVAPRGVARVEIPETKKEEENEKSSPK